MPKLRLSRKAITGFFVSHVEKLVLVVVLILFGTFVYSGMGIEGLPSDQSPEALAGLADRATQHVNADTWENVKEEFQPPTGHAQRAKRLQTAKTEGTSYATLKPYLPENKPSGRKRTDPEMLAPIEVETDVVIGPLAVHMRSTDVDLLADAENTEMLVKKKKKKKKRRGDKMTEKEFANMFGVEEEDPANDPFAMVSGGGPDVFGEGDEDKHPATGVGRTYPGYRPPEQNVTAIGEAQVVVAVKALVPVRKQWDLYQQTFAQAMHYNPGRDTPTYLSYTAQRAEVGDDPDAPLEWRRISYTTWVMENLQKANWTGLSGEIADPRYTAFELTMPIPPLMMRNPEEFALHSKVPRYVEVDPLAPSAADTDEDEEFSEPVALSLEPGSDLPSMGPLLTSNDASAGMFGAGDEGAGSFGAFGMMPGAGPGPSASAATAGPAADYVLVRFFDFTAEIGKKYRYRVQLLVDDPNHPQDERFSPLDRALDDDVRQRVTAQLEREERLGRRLPLRTEWSEPSDVVTVKVPRITLAGPINSNRELNVTSKVTMEASEATAKVLSIVFDQIHAVDIPSFTDAYRGSYFNFTQDADVIHPVTLQFKKVEDCNVKTDRMLVDFRGGKKLPEIEIEKPDKEDKSDSGFAEEEVPEEPDLMAASEYIFLDKDGNFFVRNDLDDHDVFGLYTIPEREEEEE